MAGFEVIIEGRRIIIKATWISLVSDIVPECNNVIPIGTDQLGKWMAPPNEPEVKVRRGQRNDYEHSDVLRRSGKQRVHMLGADRLGDTPLVAGARSN